MTVLPVRAAALLPVAVFSASVAFAQGPSPSRLSVHGSSDYRRAAVMARYSATPKDALVMQLAHRHLGDSPTMEFENESVSVAF